MYNNSTPETLEDRVDTSEEAFTDAGFSVERIGRTTVYERDLSHDVVEASRTFTRKRTIGFISQDIPGRGKTA